MSTRHDIRRLAMQVMYQLDVRGEADAETIRASLEDSGESSEVCRQAFELAQEAWNRHARADQLATELAPHWPTHRQPPVDRAIIRLAYHEMASGYAPTGVAINEAVILGKQFCSEQAPGFINGVLDKMSRRLRQSPTPPPPTTDAAQDAPDTPANPPTHSR